MGGLQALELVEAQLEGLSQCCTSIESSLQASRNCTVRRPLQPLPPESTTFSTPTQHLAHVSLRLVRMAVGGMRELD